MLVPLARLRKDSSGVTGLETAILLLAFVVVAAVFAYTVLSAGIFASDKGRAAIFAGLKASGGALVIAGGVTAKSLSFTGESLGTGDGSTTLFTAANTPVATGSETVYLDAAPQTRDTDYTIVYSTGAVTFTVAPGIGVAVTMDYRHGRVNELVFMVSVPLKDSVIDITTTSDSDADGLLSDESPKNHRTIFSYLDENQQVADLAWTWTQSGRVFGSSNNLLEWSETMTVTVSLKALSPGLQKDGTFTLEVKPEGGAVMRIERTIPAAIDPVMNLR